MNKIQIGEKGRHIEIPEGFNLVENDMYVTRKGDMVANIITVKWEQLLSYEVGMKAYAVGDFVITKETP